ncbi:hypothetical protein [Maricaulis maris]|uniref:hypothetical protein n=1 Tax=Maricaulis maris TaxID=74318 RepID=UPI003B8E1F61
MTEGGTDTDTPGLAREDEAAIGERLERAVPSSLSAQVLLRELLAEIRSMERFARSRGIALPDSVQANLPVLFERLGAVPSDELSIYADDVEPPDEDMRRTVTLS